MATKATFEKLFKEHYAYMCGVANKILRDRDAAEDMSQEVFADLWKKWDVFEFTSSERGYLKKAVINRSLNHIRKHKALTKLDVMPEKVDGAPSVLEELSGKELQKKILLAIDQLSPKTRAVFIASRMEQLSYKEIAAKMEISVKTVENHMMKALKQLRSAILHISMILILLFVDGLGVVDFWSVL